MTAEKCLGNTVVGWDMYDVLSILSETFAVVTLVIIVAACKGLLKTGPETNDHSPWERTNKLGEAEEMFQMAFGSSPWVVPSANIDNDTEESGDDELGLD